MKKLLICISAALSICLSATAPIVTAAETLKIAPSTPQTSMAGTWVYRSIKNVADPAEELSNMKLLVGVIEIPPYQGNEFTGTLTATNFGKEIKHILKGQINGDHFTMIALPGNDVTEGWLYNYTGWLVPMWKDGVKQVPTFVGSVLRITEHAFPGGGTSTSGGSYTIIGMKKVQ